MLGDSVLLICADFPASEEEEFNEWYFREHIPERVLGLPGFLRGRRYESLGATPKYLAMYEVEGPAALGTPEYLSVIHNPDPRSRRLIPLFQNPIRAAYSVVASAGVGSGGVVGLLGLRPEASSEESVRDRFMGGALHDLVAHRGIVAAHYLEADVEALDHSRIGHLRTGDRVVRLMIVIEAQRAEDLERQRESDLFSSTCTQGCGEAEWLGPYQLLYELSQNAGG